MSGESDQHARGRCSRIAHAAETSATHSARNGKGAAYLAATLGEGLCGSCFALELKAPAMCGDRVRFNPFLHQGTGLGELRSLGTWAAPRCGPPRIARGLRATLAKTFAKAKISRHLWLQRITIHMPKAWTWFRRAARAVGYPTQYVGRYQCLDFTVIFRV